MVERISAHMGLVGNQRERDNLEDLVVDRP
jgi:hypothetical protein